MPAQPSRHPRLCLTVTALALAAGFVFQQLLLARPLIRDDAALFVYPLFHALAQAFKSGHLYLWDTQQWCGLPALATGQSGGLYPLHLLLLRLLPWLTALHLAYWLQLVLAFLAMVWVARNLGLSRKAAVVGAVLYAFSGYSAAHLVHYNFIAAAAHLPLTLALLQTALRRNHWRWWGLLGLQVALAYLVSHPQVFLMSAATAALWLVAGQWWRDVPARPIRSRLPGLLAAALIAALLIMPQLLPTLELARESSGVYAAQQMEAHSFISSYPFRWIDLPRVVLPDLFGTAEANVIGGGPAFHETCAFVTVGALLFALVGLIAGWGRRGWWFAALLLLLGASLVPAGNPIYLLVAKIPFLSSFRAMGRWALVAIAGLSLLVGFALDTLPAASDRRRLICSKVAGLLAGLLLFALVALWATFGAEGGGLTLPGQPGKAIAVKNMAAAVYNSLIGWEPLLFIWSAVLALVALHLLSARRRLTTTAAALALLALVLPLWHFWQVTNPPGPRDYYTSPPATAAFLTARPLTPGTLPRVVTLPPELVRPDGWPEREQLTPHYGERELLTPALGTVFGLQYSGGYKQGLVTPATLRLWDDAIRYGTQAFTGVIDTSRETIERVGTAADRMKRFQRLCAAPYTVTPGLLTDPGLALQNDAPVRVYQLSSPAPAAWLVGKAIVLPDPEEQLQAIKLRSFDPEREAVVDASVPGLPGRVQGRVRVNSPQGAYETDSPTPALLVLSQAWYPGWRAYVDGQPVPLLRANYAFKAVPVPAGRHRVQLRFQSRPWTQGLLLASLGTVLLLLLICLPTRRPRPSNE